MVSELRLHILRQVFASLTELLCQVVILVVHLVLKPPDCLFHRLGYALPLILYLRADASRHAYDIDDPIVRDLEHACPTNLLAPLDRIQLLALHNIVVGVRHDRNKEV